MAVDDQDMESRTISWMRRWPHAQMGPDKKLVAFETLGGMKMFEAGAVEGCPTPGWLPLGSTPGSTSAICASELSTLTARDDRARHALTRASTRATCDALHSPSPRAVGMPRSLKPAAMARSDVAPRACRSDLGGDVRRRPLVGTPLTGGQSLCADLCRGDDATLRVNLLPNRLLRFNWLTGAPRASSGPRPSATTSCRELCRTLRSPRSAAP
jgi:hypothetical protein